MTSLLFNELCAAAAREGDIQLHSELRRIAAHIDLCQREIDTGGWEEEFQALLFRMVDRPLFELLTCVTLRFSTTRPSTEPIYRDEAAMGTWRAGRHRIIEAILARDGELARFEANRSNRAVVLDWIARQRGAEA
jgi:hypothetical protein